MLRLRPTLNNVRNLCKIHRRHAIPWGRVGSFHRPQTGSHQGRRGRLATPIPRHHARHYFQKNAPCKTTIRRLGQKRRKNRLGTRTPRASRSHRFPNNLDRLHRTLHHPTIRRRGHRTLRLGRLKPPTARSFNKTHNSGPSQRHSAQNHCCSHNAGRSQ